MQDQLAFDQLIQAVVDHAGELLLDHRLRLAADSRRRESIAGAINSSTCWRVMTVSLTTARTPSTVSA